MVKGAGRVIGVQQQSMEETYKNILVGKLNDIMDDTSHSLHERLAGLAIHRIYTCSVRQAYAKVRTFQ